MMFFEFLKYDLKEFFRARHWKTSLGLKFFLFLGISVFFLELIAAGWFANNLIDLLKTGKSAKEVFDRWLLYYFFCEFVARYFMQTVPDLKIRPYLLLNVPRQNLVHFLLGKSVFSYFNWFFLMIAVPFGIKNILLAGSTLTFIWWILTIALAIGSVNFLAMFAKTTFGTHAKATVVLLLTVVLITFTYVNEWIDYKGLSVIVFNAGPWSVLCFAAVACLSYQLNYRLKMGDLYLKEESKSAAKLTFFDTQLDKLQSTSVMSELIITELKLLFRNKIPRTMMTMSVIMLLAGLVFQFFTFMPYNLKVQLFITGIIGLSNAYGGAIPGWESTYFDGLMTRNIDFRTYLKAKYYMFVIFTLAGFLPLVFMLFIDTKLFIGGVCVIMYAVGVNAIAFIGLSNKNHLRIEIHEPAGLNKNANMGSVFGWKFFVLLVPLVLYFPFMLMNWHFYGALFLGFLGLTGLLLHGQFIKEFDEKYKETKYLMLEGFRTR